MVLTETLLHFIWRFRLFDLHALQTTEGEAVRVEHVGDYNQNEGPDFECARVYIAGTLWSGQVEIHIREEDWIKHGHQHDRHYDNTILHVVWQNAADRICRVDGTIIPTLVLSTRVDVELLERYAAMMDNLDWIPCEKQLPNVLPLTVQGCLSRMAVERLAYKVEEVVSLLDATNQHWEQVFIRLLGRAFGMKVNAAAFEALTAKVDLQLLQKYQHEPLRVESLLFGLAGFLETTDDAYSHLMKEEYKYLKRLFHLEGIGVTQWRFLRMRPYNFPTFRLAQLAALLANKSCWFMYILESTDLDTVFSCVDNSTMNDYWRTHYRIGVKTEEHSINWSTTFKIHLTINCFIPMVFAYGTFMKIDKYKEKALDWLHALPAEVNQITKAYARNQVVCSSAADSQALLHLKSTYCAHKQCLSCAIGLAILKS